MVGINCQKVEDTCQSLKSASATFYCQLRNEVLTGLGGMVVVHLWQNVTIRSPLKSLRYQMPRDF